MDCTDTKCWYFDGKCKRLGMSDENMNKEGVCWKSELHDLYFCDCNDYPKNNNKE